MNISGNTNPNHSQPSRKNSNQNIQVYARVRPLNSRERCIRSNEVIDVISPKEIMTRHTVDSKLTKKFTFDRTFGQDSRQVDVYSTVVAPLIEEVLSGYNCTVFAYGQTGTGKTHTMVGTECAELKSSWEDDSDIGIIPRALSHLFDELRLMELEFSMRISYLELYNEELCDLLSSDDSTKIRIFDDSTKKGSVIIQGLEEIPVHSKDDVYKLLEKGKERRKTATTLMNAQSSRSHTVFSILVHIRENGIDGEEMLKIGKLNLVDLAGSENVSKAGNEKGIRVRETVNINQSLLTLGRVITALVERTPHIPYRESKLTRLLQESLGGRTKTSIIATISPGHKDIEETLSTLEYAHRAKNIQNKPEVNQKLTKKTVLKEYTEEIDKLKRDLMAARDKNGIYLAEQTYNEITLKMDSQNKELNEKMLLLKALKDELQNKEKIFNEVSLNLVEKTEELKKTEKYLVQTKGDLFQTKKILNTTKRRYKEKKVLLESHLKTEQELTNQAHQILEVADCATKETYQLQKTIERRNDVDRKILTACEQFSERQNENFEIMDENLNSLQEQHKAATQHLIEELSTCNKSQSVLTTNLKSKLDSINEIWAQSLSTTESISEKFIKSLSGLDEKHKAELEKLFLDLKTEITDTKAQILCNVNEISNFNNQLKSNMDTLREEAVSKMQRMQQEMQDNTSKIQQHLCEMICQSEENMQTMQQMKTTITNEQNLAEQEQVLLDEYLAKRQTLRQQRSAFVDELNVQCTKLEGITQDVVGQLRATDQYVQNNSIKSQQSNEDDHKRMDEQITAALLCIDKSVAKCSTIQIQCKNLEQQSTKRIDNLHNVENSHCTQIQNDMDTYVNETKRLRLEENKQLEDACSTVKSVMEEDNQKVKKHMAISSEFCHSLENHITNYAQLYKKQMSECVKDVRNFKQSELKTYTPTGTTPSKRDYIYPRVLAATSPHSSIVKRVRQENDWSDLDTTATIDEASEGEDAPNSIIDISDAETILNSTPIDAPELKKKLSNGCSSNTLKPSQNTRSNSLTRKTSPNKLSPLTKSPALKRENKENIS